MVKYQVDLSAYQGLHRRSGAAKGDELNMGTGKVLEHDTAEVSGGSDARRSYQDFVLIRFHPSDQFLKVFCRHVLFRNNNRRIVGKKCDRLEVVQQIE
ncbi:MAG: hypothetical protein WBZ35_00940, partial [Pseudolabrys sp.]